MDGVNDQFANTMRAVREKKPVPEIDFTLHTMEDGTQVSTQERVCKGLLDVAIFAHLYTDMVRRGASASLQSSH